MEGRRGAQIALPVAMALSGLTFLLVTGADAVAAISILGIVAWQSLGGWLVWGIWSGRHSQVERMGMALALGTALAVLSGLGLRLVGLGGFGWAIPSLIAVAWVLLRRVRGQEGPASPQVDMDRPVAVALAVSLLVGVGSLIYGLRNYPLAWDGSWSSYHSDMPFFEALATSLARFGPDASPFLQGGVVRYHWLAYAWAGQVGESSGAAPFLSLTRVLPLVAMMGSSLIVVSWARRVSRVVWVPTLAALMLLLSGYLGAVYGGVFSLDSPSQSMSVLWLLGYSVVLLRIVEAPGVRPTLVALLAIMAFAVTGGKVSSVAPALAGVLLMLAVTLVRRQPDVRRLVWACLASWAGAALAFVLLLAGSAGGGGLQLGSLVDKASSQQGLNPLEGDLGVMVGTAILLVAIAARWGGLLWLVVDRGTRWQTATVYGTGMALASLAAAAIFNSFNEIWFAAAAAAPLAPIGANGAGRAAASLTGSRGRRKGALLIAALLSGGAIFAIVWWLWATGASGGNVWISTWRWAGPLVGVTLAAMIGLCIALWMRARPTWRGMIAATCVVLVVATLPGRLLGIGTGLVGRQENGIRHEWFSFGQAPSVRDRDEKVVSEWSSSAMAAAAWLRTKAAPTDLLASNLTFGPFVPGVTGLPTYVSGIQYQAPYGFPSYATELIRRENQVWDFIDRPSEQTFAPLCDAGVTWLWVDPTQTESRGWGPFASVVFEGNDVIIARFAPECSPAAQQR